MSRHFSALALLPLGALVACDPAVVDPIDDPHALGAGIELERFANCADLRGYMATAWTETLVQARYGYGSDLAVEDGSDGGDSSGSSPTDWSETNVQESGVDEPDMVKTDGDFIYLAHQGELTIIDSWPAEDATIVGRVELEVNPFAMFLRGDKVALFSYSWDQSPFEDDWGYNYATMVHIVDVSDRANPEVLREIALEGYYTNARMVDGDVYVVMNTWAYMPEDIWDLTWGDNQGLPELDWDASESAQSAVRARARQTYAPLVRDYVNTIPEAQLTVRYTDGVAGSSPDPQSVLGCRDVYHPAETSTPNLLSVLHFDLDEGEAGGDVSGTGVMADGWTVYASEDNLYVAQTSWWWFWGWGDLDLSTRIHRFKLDGGDTLYEATGEVDGWLLNQFSMSEYDDHLRAATTDINWWSSDEDTEDPANNVYVLDADTLNEVGHVGGIAPNEQIQSVRFHGKKGYVVTFERIDPLFTLDLSTPAAPRVVGELELPGFSTYLHPFGNDHLLAVGFAGTMEGEITGFAVNLFDVSDMSAPKLASQLTLESDDWSWSQSLWDHHAFTLHRDVLSLPIYTYDYDESTGDYDAFSGMWVIDATDLEAGLSELGRVDHEDLINDSECLYGSDSDSDSDCDEYYWYAWMKRSVIIEDKLFSISDYGIKVTQLDDPTDEISSVLFWAR